MPKVLCLLYHRVIPYEKDAYQIKVKPETFDNHIKFLSENYPIIKFDDDWSDINEDSIVVTFDDGYMDNYLYAYPILKKYQVPATIFVTSGNIGTNREFWWDDLLRLCVCRKTKWKAFKLCDDLLNYTWQTETEDQCLDMALSLRYILRREDNIQIFSSFFSQLKEWSGLNDDGREENYSMSKKQIIEMSESQLITIGGHTINHFSLGCLSLERQKRECKQSICDIEQIINRKIGVFSYPFGGRQDYTNDTINILRNSGIEKAATTENRCYIQGDDNFTIPRISMKDISLNSFKTEISKRFNDATG